MEIALIILLSTIFGVSQKLADAVNEHRTILFYGSNIFFGILFGVSGIFLANMNSDFTEFFIGLIFYWLLSGKLDYFNHQLSACMIIGGVFVNTNCHFSTIFNFLFVVCSFFLLKYIKYLTKKTNSFTIVFFNGRFQHFILAIIMGVWFENIYLSISILCTMISILLTIKVLKINNNYYEIV
ncbi:MAG: hypothetical protein KDC31_10260 [Saprospiraceae bacterium]|nr:hypothetical protein [Saprospiraceae bacterium]HCN38084.1 hypothetical protein [Bacteroidota bacterium]MCB0591666.1 hypothetical protein [Saprospiraceae bacterium]MCO5283838.1 hypothetical protein [Saprospiraceae bacterium]MCO6470173.1 hypothetical protein [Saprospiraceae bacterium]